MNKQAFEEAYENILGMEASSMVLAQVARLRMEYSHQQIFNAIWYFYIKRKSIQISSIDTYGIGLLRDAKNMEEALGYFRRLALTRERASESAKQGKKVKPQVIVVKRPKQRIYREEYDWNDE